MEESFGWQNPNRKPKAVVTPLHEAHRRRNAVRGEDLRALLNGPSRAQVPSDQAPAELPACPDDEFVRLCDWIATAHGLDGRGDHTVSLVFIAAIAVRKYAEPVHMYVLAIACARAGSRAWSGGRYGCSMSAT